MNKGSRKELKRKIKKGLVMINGHICTDPGTEVSEKDEVILEALPVHYRSYEYYMMNKPDGVITATEDRRQETVFDLLGDDRRKDIFPVGRLDKDTVGLLLLTNDGDLNHRLLSPRKHVEKEYYAHIDGKVTEEDIIAFAEGLFIEEGFTALPAKLKILSYRETPMKSDFEELERSNAPKSGLKNGVSEISVIVEEGKYHQIKKMFHKIGKEVIYLKRIRFGKIFLDENLKEGECRALTEEEIKLLKE